LGIGDWGLGPIPNPQSPIPNPQSPFGDFLLNKLIYKIIFIKNNKNISYIKLISKCNCINNLPRKLKNV